MEGKSRKIKILIGLIALIVLAFGPFKPKDKNNENVNTAEVNLKKVIIGLPGISNQTLEATGIAVNKGYIAEELKKVELTAPVKRGDIVLKNIFNTGVNVVVTKDM